MRVRDILPGSAGSDARPVASVNGVLYFTVYINFRFQLWKSDGTEAGTVPVDPRLGGASGAMPWKGGLVLPASASDTGQELWWTDGTAEGTRLLADIRPGAGSSQPINLVADGDTLYFTADDGQSGRELWSIVALTDTTPPTVTCPQSLTVEAEGPQGATVSYAAASATDDFPGSPTLGYSHPSGGVFSLGDTTVTVTATDDAGNAATCAFTVTVSDTRAPTVSCPGDVEAVATSAEGATVEYPRASATDGVSSASVTYSQASGTTFGIGVTVVTATATDSAGNAAACAFNVTVSPPAAPSITCPSETVAEATGADGAIVSFPSATASGMEPLQVTYSRAPGSRFPLGTSVVTATVRDALERTASCEFSIVVRDTTAPALACPMAVVAEATGAQGATVEYPPVTASDGVSAPVTVRYSQASGTLFPLGATTVSVTATDAVGNAASCAFTVTVRDTTAPTLTCPASFTAEATSADGATVGFPVATASDAVTSTVVLAYSREQGSVFALGTTELSVSATDAAGNAASCTFTITVQDTTPPELTCPVDIVAEATNATGSEVTYAIVAPQDAVSGSSVTVGTSAPSGSRFALGETSVRITATDAAGNAASCTFTVTVRDSTAPMLTCPVDIVAEAQGPEGAEVFPRPSAITTDAVTSSVEVTYSRVDVYFPLGVTTVSVTARDAAGNTSACAFTVTVRDTTPPEASCPASTEAEAQSDEGASNVPLISRLPRDAVTRFPTVSSTHPRGAPFPLGTTEVTLTTTDEAGNASTCAFTVTVRDTTAPALSCPVDVTAQATEPSGLEVPYAEAVTSDAVSSPAVVYSQASGTRFTVGTTPVSVTATDAAGNSASCEFHVTVQPPAREPVSTDAPETLGWGCSTGAGPSSGLGWGALLLLVWGASRRRLAGSRR
ncbi:HYR domain-containing protein [Pyxidicoccus sp. 3LFB2]